MMWDQVGAPGAEMTRLEAIVDHIVAIIARNGAVLELMAKSGLMIEISMLAGLLAPIGKALWKAHGPNGLGHDPNQVGYDPADYPAFSAAS